MFVNGTEFFFRYLQKSKLLQRAQILLAKRKQQEYLHFLDQIEEWSGKGLEYLSARALSSKKWRREFFRFNEIYSHDLALKRFSGIPYEYSLEVMVEHGLILSETIIENSNKYPLAQKNIVMSNPRVDFLARNEVPSIAIGPYIHYAKSIFDEEKTGAVKKKMGKTLLFFAGHSTREISVERSYAEMFRIIDGLQLQQNFDTVLICGHFVDIEQGLFSIAPKNEKYQYISAGYNRCPAFLDLLRTYIELSDVVASNSIGTQTGYSIFLGKPFWVVNEDSIDKFYSGNQRVLREHRRVIKNAIIGKHQLSYLELEDCFKEQVATVDKANYELVADLWGFDEVKRPDELREILLN